MAPPISKFSGRYRFLSNFFPAPIVMSFVHEGKRYRFLMPTVENAFQAAKVDTHIIGRVARIRAFVDLTAGEAKRAGRKVALRSDWEGIKLSIMHALLVQKFSHADLRARLLATGDTELIEGNTWGDTWWGVDLRTGEGENHLGKTLMRVRAEIQSA
jgi:hypothetical protein